MSKFIVRDDEVDSSDYDSSDEGLDYSNILGTRTRNGGTSSSDDSSEDLLPPRKKKRLILNDETSLEEESEESEEEWVFSTEDQERKMTVLCQLADGYDTRNTTNVFLESCEGHALELCQQMARILGVDEPFVIFTSKLGAMQPSCVCYRKTGSFPPYIQVNSQLATNDADMRRICVHAMAHWYAFKKHAPTLLRGHDASSAIEAGLFNEAEAHSSPHFRQAVAVLQGKGFAMGDLTGKGFTFPFKAVMLCPCGAFFASTTMRGDLESSGGLEHYECPLEENFRLVAQWKATTLKEPWLAQHPLNVKGFLKEEVAKIVHDLYDQDEDGTWPGVPYLVEEPRHTTEQEEYWDRPTLRMLRCFRHIDPPKDIRARNRSCAGEMSNFIVD